MKIPSISHAEFTRQFNYDAATGVFTRLVTTGPNNRYQAGTLAGGLSNYGYVRMLIAGVSVQAHRAAWFYTHGVWPKDNIDHKNLDKSDNRIANLRLATRSQNSANRERVVTNTSGYKGVHKFKRTGRYSAKCGAEHLGYFDTPDEAAEKYNAAAVLKYGEYAKLNLVRSAVQ